MLAAADVIDERILIGVIPARGKGITLEQAAVHAVMAGCKPEYFPVVVAAFEALFDASFNAHTALTSTGGAAVAVVVSGPIAQEIGMNGRHNCLGSGNRANLTIGRAVRLAAMNVLGARAGELDASSFGHQGKISFCFAEDPPPAPWLPLHEQLGYEPGDTTVTLMPVEGVRQLAQQLNGDAEGILRTFATAMKTPFTFSTGKGGQGIMILGPEHAGFCIEQGWTQAAVREFLCQESRISPEELLAVGVSDRERRPARDDPRRGRQARLPPRARRHLPRHRRRRGRGLVGLRSLLGAEDPLQGLDPARASHRRADARLRPGRLHRSLAARTPHEHDHRLPPGRRERAADHRRARAAGWAAGAPRDRDRRQPASRTRAQILEILADELGQRLGDCEVVLMQKKGAGNPMPPEMATDMAARAHLVITGVGD